MGFHPPNAPIRGVGVPLVDISLHKQFALGEEKTLDSRVDFLDLWIWKGNLRGMVYILICDSRHPILQTLSGASC